MADPPPRRAKGSIIHAHSPTPQTRSVAFEHRDLMMIAAGALIWANTVQRVHERGHWLCYYGWPARIFETYSWRDEYGNRVFHVTNVDAPRQEKDYVMGLLDVLFALAILFAVWYVTEWLIRRRAARKGA